jgi:hypothetical protein
MGARVARLSDGGKRYLAHACVVPAGKLRFLDDLSQRDNADPVAVPSHVFVAILPRHLCLYDHGPARLFERYEHS